MTSQIKSVETWPNFFIVGAPKAGTTSLYEYLKNVPDIYMSTRKEPHYFSKVHLINDLQKPIRDKNQYLKLFENVKNEKVVGEASTTYLAEPESALRIHQIVPQAHIIISLRDPVEKYSSQYFHYFRNKGIKLSFHEQLQMRIENKMEHPDPYPELNLFRFSEKVKNYLDIFGKKQVKIIIFEEFIKNPKETINDILKFLDIKYELQNFIPEVHNQFGVVRGPVAQAILQNKNIRRIAKKILSSSKRQFLREKFLVKYLPKPEMESKDREFLIKFYKDDVKEMQKILGRELPWPNFKN